MNNGKLSNSRAAKMNLAAQRVKDGFYLREEVYNIIVEEVIKEMVLDK